MSEILTLIVLTLMAGMAVPIGGAFAKIDHLRPDWLDRELRHFIIAIGGGALLSAVALVLVPQGSEELAILPAVSFLIAGALAFMALDITLYRLQTPASQLAAMLSDFLPEAIALGAAFSEGGGGAYLLAFLITLQNLPEGFNAFRELKAAKYFTERKILLFFTALAFLGPLAGLTGYLLLADNKPAVASIMLFAAGGILYSVFQDIAPQAKLNRHWAPPLGAILGFAMGLVGHMLT